MKCTKEKREAALKIISLIFDIEGNEEEDWFFAYSGKANILRAYTEHSTRSEIWIRLDDKQSIDETIEDLYELALRSVLKGEENEQI